MKIALKATISNNQWPLYLKAWWIYDMRELMLFCEFRRSLDTWFGSQ